MYLHRILTSCITFVKWLFFYLKYFIAILIPYGYSKINFRVLVTNMITCNVVQKLNIFSEVKV